MRLSAFCLQLKTSFQHIINTSLSLFRNRVDKKSSFDFAAITIGQATGKGNMVFALGKLLKDICKIVVSWKISGGWALTANLLFIKLLLVLSISIF